MRTEKRGRKRAAARAAGEGGREACVSELVRPLAIVVVVVVVVVVERHRSTERKKMLRKGGKSTSIVSGVRRKVHTTFEDGREMVEEYDTVTDELCTRKVRTAKSALGREGTWVYEVGEEPKALSAETGTIAESGSNVRTNRHTRPSLLTCLAGIGSRVVAMSQPRMHAIYSSYALFATSELDPFRIWIGDDPARSVAKLSSVAACRALWRANFVSPAMPVPIPRRCLRATAIRV